MNKDFHIVWKETLTGGGGGINNAHESMHYLKWIYNAHEIHAYCKIRCDMNMMTEWFMCLSNLMIEILIPLGLTCRV